MNKLPAALRLMLPGVLALASCARTATTPPPGTAGTEPPLTVTHGPTGSPEPTKTGTPQPVCGVPPDVSGEVPADFTVEAIGELVQLANAQYAAALQAVDLSLLDATWHGEAHAQWAESVARLAAGGRCRVSDYQIEVTTAYHTEDARAIAKTIETWSFRELNPSTGEELDAGSSGPLYETYYLEAVVGRWSVERLHISDHPTLTLTELRGEVRVDGQAAARDREVSPDQEIVTAAGSSAVLLYPFDSTTEIGPDGHLKLTSLSVNPDSSAPEPRAHAEFDLLGTSLWNRLRALVKALFRGPTGAYANDDPDAEFGVVLFEDGTLRVDVLAGEVEVANAGVTLTIPSRASAVAAPGGRPSQIAFAGPVSRAPATVAWAFNLRSRPLDVLGVRVAFAYATDREAAAEQAGRLASAASSFTPPEILGAEPDQAYPFDPAKAREFLQVSAPEGLPGLRLLAPEGFEPQVELARANWEQYLGAKIEVEIVPVDEYPSRLQKDPGDIFLVNWVARYPDPYSYLRPPFFADSPFNYGGYASTSFEQAVLEAAESPDPIEKSTFYALAEAILRGGEAVVIPVYYYTVTGK